MKTLKLSLPQKNFEGLHSAADGRGMYCKVGKRDLAALLVDHTRALAMLADMQVPTEEE